MAVAAPQLVRTTGGGVVDVDRQKAALVVVGIEERQVLVAMSHC
jgi:hydroxymethylglutaryl-CoA reductase